MNYKVEIIVMIVDTENWVNEVSDRLTALYAINLLIYFTLYLSTDC